VDVTTLEVWIDVRDKLRGGFGGIGACTVGEWGSEVDVGRCMRAFGRLGDEMVGLRIKQHQVGLNRLLQAALIGRTSYDQRSYLHLVFDQEH
jgi:hypothetical protein